MAQDRKLPFTYDKMKSWYVTQEAKTLGPALKTVERYLKELIHDEIVEQDRPRIKLRPGRIKSAARLWDKINQPRYLSDIASLEDIPKVIDDLVGVRIVCNNTSDIGTVQQMLLSLPDFEDECSAPITLVSSKERNYQQDPKPSGYRAYHINLCVQVGSSYGAWTSVSVELQVRTLLQDGWGELTHEETYKPGTELPPLITALARRMANLLSCVDEIAQDLRDVLDDRSLLRLSEEKGVSARNYRESSPLEDAWGKTGFHVMLRDFSYPQTLQSETFPEEAILQETRALVDALRSPTPLATIAFQLQSLFGSHIAQLHWGRFGSFKNLLRTAVPGVRIENVGPGWILPPGFGVHDIPALAADAQSNVDPDVPDVIVALKDFEPGLPVVSRDDLSRYINAAAAALNEELWARLGITRTSLGMRDVNLLSKEIRDQLSKAGKSLARRRLSYILLALLNSGNLRPGLTSDELRLIFAAFLESRIGHHGINMSLQDREAVQAWVTGTVTG